MEPLEACPWGCGLAYRHDPDAPGCPPSAVNAPWANGPHKALGSDRQLRGDVAILKSMMFPGMDRDCLAFVRRRLEAVNSELDRRARPQ